MKRNLLVTGGAGFIGSNFVRLAKGQGYRMVVLDALTYAGRRENLEDVLSPGEVDFMEGNICDGPLVLNLLNKFQISGVINFAAESHVDRSIEGPAPFIQTNILGTFTLLRSSLDYFESLPFEKQKEFCYLQVSTDEVFGSLGTNGKFSEITPMAPNSPYSASKAAGDHLTRAWHHTYGLPALTTHSSNNYGPRQFPEKFIPRMIACALAGEPLPVYGEGKNIRDWIHVADHCSGILLALEHGKPGETYCFGGNSERSNLEVAHLLCRELDKVYPRPDGTGHETAIGFVKDRPGHDFRYAIDDSLARKKLGFKPAYTFEEGLRETVRWYVEHQEWCRTAPMVFG